MAATLRDCLAGPTGVLAPLVTNPLMARLAEQAGFEAGYVGGGALGFLSCATEANLGLTEIAQLGLQIRAATRLPLVMDGVCGWGDPMHMRHTVATAEAAGFVAIEIEDQILPKRAHHHVGVEHIIPSDLMAAKIHEAVAARRDPDFLIIGRTGGVRINGLDDGLRRAEAMHRAGADVLLVMPGTPEHIRIIAERLPKPLMFLLPTAGIASIDVTVEELWALGYTLVADPATPLFSMVRAMRDCYQALRHGRADPLIGATGAEEEQQVHAAIGLAELLAIEAATVEMSVAPAPGG